MNYIQKYQQISNGTSQEDRLPRDLVAGYLKLDDRTFEDLLREMVYFASDVSSNDSLPSGSIGGQNGIPFCGIADVSSDDILLKEPMLREMMQEGSVPPHLALLMAFLKLFQSQQKNFNSITERHLQFFYQDVLGFRPKKGFVGKTTLFLEIAKGQNSVFIPKGTLFDAGKDASGKPIEYVTLDEMTLNRAKVKSSLACCYGSSDSSEKGGAKIYPLPLGKPENTPSTTSKGSSSSSAGGVSPTTTNGRTSALPANYGFAISSPQLMLEETADIEIRKGGDCDFSFSDFEVSYTGKSGWNAIAANSDGDDILRIPKDQGVLPYDKKIHGEGFETQDPIVRFVAKDISKLTGFSSCPSFSVCVKDSGNLLVKNAYGIVPNQVGMFPFGPLCREGEYFTIEAGYEGARIENAPRIKGSLWLCDIQESRSLSDFIPADSSTESFKRNANTSRSRASSSPSTRRRPQKLIETKGPDPQNNGRMEFFLNVDNYDQQHNAIKMAKGFIDYSNAKSNPSAGGSLSPEDFGADCYVQPISINTPFFADLSFSLSSCQFFAFTPWGLLDVDGMGGSGGLNVSSGSGALVNSASAGGGEANTPLFPELSDIDDDVVNRRDSVQICIENMDASTIVSLYFQIDPLKNREVKPLSTQWYYYTTKGWKEFANRDVLKDSTSSLLRNGVVYLRIPEEAISPTGVLPGGQALVKVSFKKGKLDDYTLIQNICTQALEVGYSPTSQGIMKAGEILPANSIKRLVNTIQGVKKIVQPYPGEMGNPDETEEKFLCRVSERLRHKGRAWSAWDYERHVLENFPQIAMAKCICGVDSSGKAKAGGVLLIVVPIHGSFDQEDLCCPKASDELLGRVSSSLKEISSPFAEIEVVNPTYVKMTVAADLKLREGYNDERYYKSFISEQLVKFISPWSDDNSNAFFTKMKSEYDVFYFLENLECVDYVISVNIDWEEPSKASDFIIYTSAQTHTIEF